jgi:hypothetical protein
MQGNEEVPGSANDFFTLDGMLYIRVWGVTHFATRRDLVGKGGIIRVIRKLGDLKSKSNAICRILFLVEIRPE